MASQPITRVASEEYLAWEREQEGKHEYFDGEIVAMAGASFVHGLIVGNLIDALSEKLRGTKCRQFISDLRLAVGPGLICYPDIIIACPPFQFLPKTTDTLNNPTFLIEVLSPSTQATDRSFKLPRYQALPSLSGYLFIEQDRVSVEHGKRLPNNHWQVQTFTNPADRIDLAPLPVIFDLASIYAEVPF